MAYAEVNGLAVNWLQMRVRATKSLFIGCTTPALTGKQPNWIAFKGSEVLLVDWDRRTENVSTFTTLVALHLLTGWALAPESGLREPSVG